MLTASAIGIKLSRCSHSRVRLLVKSWCCNKSYRAFHSSYLYQDSAIKTPLDEYNRLVKLGQLRSDPYQEGIIKSLSQLYNSLITYHPPAVPKASMKDQTSVLNSIWGKVKSLTGSSKVNDYRVSSASDSSYPKGIYLYGDVGCGKTMLMDLFYETVPPHISKKRLHFHQFMQYVHKRSHEIIREQNLDVLSNNNRRDFDVVPFLASEIAEQAHLLCFDEFQVTDVADAMLLRRLLTILFTKEYGVVLFATSNRPPDDLYINGVQRETFIPCIEIIKQRTAVTFLDSPTDYRKIQRPMSSVYWSPKDKNSDYFSAHNDAAKQAHIKEWYDYFAQEHASGKSSNVDDKGHSMFGVVHDFPLTIWGREFLVPTCTPPRVAQFTFKQLCGEPLAAGDYLALASNFRAFIVTDIPYLTVYVRDEIRRFITFLDAVYDSGGKLATTGASSFQNLFVEPDSLESDFKLKEHSSSDSKGIESMELDESQEKLMKEHGFSKEIAKKSQIFALDEERFAFARALSRLSQMSSQDWVTKP